MDARLVIVLREKFAGKELQVQQVLETALLVIIVRHRTISWEFTLAPRERTKLLQDLPHQARHAPHALPVNIVHQELLPLKIVFLASTVHPELNMQLNIHVRMINGQTREQLPPLAVSPALMVINAFKELRISANPATTVKEQ